MGSDVAYAQIMISSIMVVIVRGMATSTVTMLCSTAFGAGNLRLTGIYLQLALMCSSVAALLLGPLWVFGGQVLRGLVGHEHISADDAFNISAFLRISLLWVLPLAWTSSITNFMLAQKITRPQMFIMMAGLLLNLGANFGLIYGLDF